METQKATAAVVAAPTVKGRGENTLMEKAPPKIISFKRVNSMELKLDTIYEDSTTSQVTENLSCVMSPDWLKTKTTMIGVHQGGASATSA